MSETKSFIFAGRHFTPVSDKYYNLSTGRFVSSKPKGVKDVMLVETPVKLAGTPVQLAEFFRTNNLPLPLEVKALLPPEEKALTPLEKAMSSADPLTRALAATKAVQSAAFSQAPISSVASNVVSPTSSGEGVDYCLPAGSALISSNSTVRDINDDVAKSLCTFNLSGLKTLAKVLTVLDGDTMDVLVRVPLTLFGQLRSERKIRGPAALIAAEKSIKLEDIGLFVSVRLRLDSLDATELHLKGGQINPAGVAAKEYVEGFIKRGGGFINVQLLGMDKYGRTLAILYEDEKFQQPITPKLLNYVHPVYGKLYNGYFGGTKQEFVGGTVEITSPPASFSQFAQPPLFSQFAQSQQSFTPFAPQSQSQFSQFASQPQQQQSQFSQFASSQPQSQQSQFVSTSFNPQQYQPQQPQSQQLFNQFAPSSSVSLSQQFGAMSFQPQPGRLGIPGV